MGRNRVNGGPIRVLLCDDHPAIRAGIRKALEKAEIAVVGEAARGDEALRMIEDLAPDVVLLDCRLPGLTGIEVAAQLAERGLSTRVVALSAFAEDQYIYGMLKAGALGYLLKEEPLETVVAAVRAVAQGKKWYSEPVVSKITDWALGAPSALLRVKTLTERELQVLRLLVQGWSNNRIARDLCIGEQTVKNHVTSIYSKLKARSRAELVAWAWEHGVIVERPG